MSFLNIALLGGALALAIPIIIHLFHKSRFQIVKWGAMHLLEAVIRTNQRRIRIEQIILLIIRAAIPAVLALCMARPVWKGMHKLVGEARTSTVILLDNSYSMAASRAGTSNFSLAKDEASRLLNELPRGSDAQVVLMGEGGAPLLDEPTYDLARLTQALKSIEATYGTATVPAGLDFAANVFGQMHESSRNLVVMTDFQRISFEATEDAEVGQMLDRLRKLPLPPEITFFDVGSEVKDNVAIESLDYSRLMVGIGQKIQIRANLRNFGDAPYQDLRVYFKADGKERSMAQIRLGPHEKGQVLFTHAFETAGSHVVEVVADADPLKADNSYLASIPVRDKIPVLLVNGDPSAEPLKGETDFAEIALQPYSATGRVALADLISTKVVRTENLDAAGINAAAVVVLANVRQLDGGQLHALEEYVRNGGGLLIFPGNRVDAAWTNSALFKDGKGLLPLALGALGGDLKEGAPSIGIVSQRFDHPALDLFNDPRNGTVSDAAIKMWYRLKEPAVASANAPTIVARLTSGDPFLVEKQFGDGRVIQCAVPCDADWSNLPMRPFYLPMMQRLAIYLASTVFPPRNLEVSKPLVAFLPVGDAGKKASLALPDGTTREVPVVKKNERGVVEYGRTQQPGLYTLTAPSGTATHFVVNTSRRESDLQKLTDAEIADFAKSHGISVVHSGAEYKQLDRTRRFGSEFWRPLLWLLLVLIFAELFLQQRFARVRRAKLDEGFPQGMPRRHGSRI
ncbi:MAG: VWA domain-containing protein [Chthoniobacter sp.]|nr:VWA domain-containing protein [Chthoniobacter sp.]